MKDKRILIADFDEESLIALSNLVYEEGFQAETATDGLTAYDKFSSGDIDLVILEPMLPKLHGFELCKKIKQHSARNTPIIIVTAIYREPSCKMEALKVHGASAFFTKPYNKDELRSKMLQLLVEAEDHRPGKEAVRPAAPAYAPPKSASPELKDIMATKTVMRESRMAKPIDDIERELQKAVSDLVSPAKKKEVRVTPQVEARPARGGVPAGDAKKETKEGLDKDIDNLLKGAIGELGMEPKKRKPEMPPPVEKPVFEPRPVKTGPTVKPTPPVRPDTWTGETEKIPVAKEIKQRLPVPEPPAPSAPRPAPRAHLDETHKPFDIDRTLIEIDKIPLDIEKPQAEAGVGTSLPFGLDKKRELFHEYGGTRKKRMTLAVVGALAAVILIGTSITFLVLKSKKSSPPPQEVAASVSKAIQPGPSAVKGDSKPYPDSQEAELKPEQKKPVAKAPEQPTELAAPIQPALPSENGPVRIQEQTTATPQSASQGSEPTAAPQTPPAEQGTNVQPPVNESAASKEAPQVPSAPAEKTKPGALVALDKVDTAPVLVRKVEPKYPPLALRAGVGGLITVNALISENGDVLRTEILKGVRNGFGLEEAAATAVRQWKFRPAQKDGANVKVWKPIDINFKPSQKPSKE
jgi:TonB family protein